MKVPTRMRSFGPASQRGFTLVETVFSLAIAGLTMSSVMTLNSQQLKVVKSAQESTAASLCLQERIEQLRIANWKQVTDATYIKETYFASVPKSMAALNDYTERISVVAYPNPAACAKLEVEKMRKSLAQTLSNGTGLPAQRLAQVNLEMRWIGKGGRERARQYTTLISNGGISRFNLPAMGNVAGAPAFPTTPAPTTTSTTSTATPAPTVAPSPTSGAATPVPGAASSNGRGTVKSPNGKK